ncbi:MAG: Stp1/IreP family PP2C-type Ser/Thr phosphatase [Brachymonas sp.]|jgi:serine/threonine protein phosphatase PrpC
MKYEFVALTDVGRMRQNNEDSVAYTVETGVAVLADGMGGYNAGEVASGMSTAFLNSELSRWVQQAGKKTHLSDIKRAISICVGNANLSVFNAASNNASYQGMGTTLVVGMLQQNHFIIGHIGDSRAYLLRAEVLQQITKDHSMLQEQIDAGLITPEQAPFAANKNLVTRAVGVGPFVDVEIHEHPIEVGDVFMFCSDGLSDMVSQDSMQEVLRNHNISLQSRAQNLIDAANAAGGRDNISVLMVQALPGTEKSGFAQQLGKLFSKK